MQNLILRDTTVDSKNFVAIIYWKLKLHQSEVKNAILQTERSVFP